MIQFVDTHTHIYAGEFRGELTAVVNRAVEAGVTTLLLPAIDRSTHAEMVQVVQQFPVVCKAMMGLHPTSVKENYFEELDEVERYLGDPEYDFCAIGEVGIDLYWDKSYEIQQKIAFATQVELALTYDLPLVIHTRNAMDVVLDMLEERNDPRLHGVFHCFGGNSKQAGRAIQLGFLLGIGGVVTYRNSGLQEVVQEVPLTSILLETDAPWLPPVPHRGKQNEPAYIPLIAQKIAEIKNIPIEEVAEATTRNAKKLFRI